MRIDISCAKKLISNYKQNHWTTINGSCPSLHANPFYPMVQDSRSVWFSLSDLQSFINDIGNQADGIRFYFGEYSPEIINDVMINDPNAFGQNPNMIQYAGLHTLVLIPTALDPSCGLSRDFNYNQVNAGCPVLPADFSNGAELAAENHGSLIPPPFYNNLATPVQAATVVTATMQGGGAANQATAPNPVGGQDFMVFCDTHP